MGKKLALASSIPVIAFLLAVTSVARADPPGSAYTIEGSERAAVCQQRLSEVKAEWQASRIPTSAARAAGWGAGGAKNHDHPGMVTNYMQRQLNEAEQLCQKGDDHGSLLRIDEVRAWLNLPFEEHPVSHGYHPENKAG